MPEDLLAKVPLFSKMSQTDRIELAALMQTRTFVDQQPVFFVDEPGGDFYIVREGRVAIVYPDENGKEATLALLPAGAFFGEISLLDGGTRTATARAVGPTVLHSLDREQFYDFLRKNPEAGVHVMTVLGHRQRETVEKLRGIRNVNQAVEETTTPLQKLLERVAGFGASELFLFGNILFIVLWITVQTILAIRDERRIVFLDDPPTFFWLGFIIAMESILLTMFVLTSQKRQADRDRIRADLEYQVNLKAHGEVMQLHRKIDHLTEMVQEQASQPPSDRQP